jgi:hypothetical protein
MISLRVIVPVAATSSASSVGPCGLLGP